MTIAKKSISAMTYNEYNRRRRKSIIQKDACKECEILKIKESNLLNYGVEYIAKLPNVRKQISQAKQTNYDEVVESFHENGYVLLTKEYTNWQQELCFICKKHVTEGVQKTNYKNIQRSKNVCIYCHSECVRELYGGNSPSALTTYLRRNMSRSWKNKSMKECDYKCVISNKRFDDIHHLYSFNSIVYEAINNVNMDTYDDIELYTDKQLFKITREVNRLHKLYPLGVCLTKEIHTLFHNIYGYGNNTPEQFKEFKARLKLGEFNDFLEENNLELAI